MSVVERLRRSAAVERIRHERLLAVLRKVDPARLDSVVRALCDGGIAIIEITLDSEDAPAAIARLRQIHPELLVVAGTVRSAADVDAAVEAGAQLCVAPGFRADMVERCLELGVPAVPGALTPTEIEAAWSLGAALVKIFPGELGGPEYIRDIHGPLADVPLLVTGGVDASNAQAFLEAGAVAVGAGSTLTGAADVTAAARALLTAVQAAR